MRLVIQTASGQESRFYDVPADGEFEIRQIPSGTATLYVFTYERGIEVQAADPLMLAVGQGETLRQDVIISSEIGS